MWTQRDQIQAYQFLRRRLVSALVSADANHPVSPSRRLVLGTVLGLIATLIVTAAFGILGVLRPGTSSDWKKPGQVVIEKETGSRYIMAGDGLLHPVLNFASARLLAGGNGTRTTTVPAKQLASVGRGSPLGIVGAPDSLPAAGRISRGPATVCSQSAADLPAATGPLTVLRWSAPIAGRLLGTGQALLVTDGTSKQLLAGGYRFRLPGPGQAAALGLSGQQLSRVSAAWLSAVPSGADLDFLAVTGAGQPGPRVGSGTVAIGSVLVVSNPALRPAATEYYLVLKAGLAPVTAVQAQLALSAPANRAAGLSGKPVPVTADQLVGVATAALPDRLNSLAQQLSAAPQLVGLPAASPVCLVTGAGSPQLLVADPGTDVTAGATAPVSTTATLTADRVAIRPGSGALVADRPAGAAGTTYLLADDGIKYPIPSAAAQVALGYGMLASVQLSSAVLALLPSGPALDPAAAQRVVAAGAR
ncbi:MAG: type VII secretion protein EccB [Jatrophihabitans sp.]